MSFYWLGTDKNMGVKKMGELDKQSYLIKAVWDCEASVWVATSESVIGLVAEASTMESLVEKLKVLIPELLELNGDMPSNYDSIPFHLSTELDEVAMVRSH